VEANTLEWFTQSPRRVNNFDVIRAALGRADEGHPPAGRTPERPSIELERRRRRSPGTSLRRPGASYPQTMEASHATSPSRCRPFAARGGVRQVVADYVELTKPKVQSLLLLTTVCTMEIAGDPSVGLIAVTVLGGYLSAGGAGAVNHYFDRDIDALMRARRPPVPAVASRRAPR